MGSAVEVKLSLSCYEGGGCCEDPCSPRWVRDEVTGEVVRIDAVPQEELQAEETAKYSRLRSLGRKVMAPLA